MLILVKIETNEYSFISYIVVIVNSRVIPMKLVICHFQNGSLQIMFFPNQIFD